MKDVHIAYLRVQVVELARRQGSLITRKDITCRLGGTSRQITRLTREGLLTRVEPGIFVLTGTPIDYQLRIRVALLAAGPDALASHGSAAWLQGIVDRPPPRVHVTARAERRGAAGAVVHRSKVPTPKGPRFRAIACTPPGRTLVDLAATATPSELADAVDRALAKGLIRTKDLVALTKRGRGGRPGVAALRRCLDERGLTNVPTPSVLESKMARLMIRYRLPPARPEHIAGELGEYRIDYAYPPERVAVELHGYASHRTPEQLRADQARQRRLTLQGWTVVVFTWRDVVHNPAMVARDLRQALRNCSNAAQSTKSETLKS